MQIEAQSHYVGISSVSAIPVTYHDIHSCSGPLPSILQDNFIFLASKDHLQLFPWSLSISPNGKMETSPELMLAGRLAIWTLISSPLLLHPMRQKIQHWIPFKLFPLRSLANTWKGLRLNLNLTLSLTQASQDSWPSLTFNHFQKSGKKCVPTLPDSPPRPPLPGQILVVNPRWQWREKRTIRMHGCLFSSWHMLDTWNAWSLWKE